MKCGECGIDSHEHYEIMKDRDALLDACYLASHVISQHYTEAQSVELQVIRKAIKRAVLCIGIKGKK